MISDANVPSFIEGEGLNFDMVFAEKTYRTVVSFFFLHSKITGRELIL